MNNATSMKSSAKLSGLISHGPVAAAGTAGGAYRNEDRDSPAYNQASLLCKGMQKYSTEGKFVRTTSYKLFTTRKLRRIVSARYSLRRSSKPTICNTFCGHRVCTNFKGKKSDIEQESARGLHRAKNCINTMVGFRWRRRHSVRVRRCLWPAQRAIAVTLPASRAIGG